uniref:Uncharacterized protein n=1 Tax=Anthoceros agrestis TaxID=41834 RepID=A0A6M8AYG4_9EMBR|nr:hypothetical protein [Anthoceros agrestis]QKD76622.1 hypothetical protein [Anthoceros agrestis]
MMNISGMLYNKLAKVRLLCIWFVSHFLLFLGLTVACCYSVLPVDALAHPSSVFSRPSLAVFPFNLTARKRRTARVVVLPFSIRLTNWSRSHMSFSIFLFPFIGFLDFVGYLVSDLILQQPRS